MAPGTRAHDHFLPSPGIVYPLIALEEDTGRFGLRSISSEQVLENYERIVVKDDVRDTITELCKIDAARDEFGLGDGIWFDNHTNSFNPRGGSETNANQPSGIHRPQPNQFSIHPVYGNTNNFKCCFIPPSPLILDFQGLSLSDISLSGGGSRGGPDWVALVENEVAVILNDKDDVLLGGGVRVPDCFTIVGAAHEFVSQMELLYKVSICLHFDSLHIVALLLGVLPLWIAVLVHNNFAVLLHSEFVDAILTPQAVALEQPLVVSKGVVSVRHIEWDLWMERAVR
ncbi:hypothetical protein N7452_009638 [Penicillium brevicompactum]|uniref:Uncharacterized protein n=1 Tax=Penicillium brevicompactum TaxID=5074 RepID=A0A9W9QBJ8_PENBR|nr:hypothetical protein N7452_009638 [Penicillium brevicompactum]